MGGVSRLDRQGDDTTDQPVFISHAEIEEIARAVSQAAEVPVEVDAEEDWQASYYWDVATMAPLNKASAVSQDLDVEVIQDANTKTTGRSCPVEGV